MKLDESCIFCKIIQGDIPSHKIYENEKVYAFLDINPMSEGHALIIPKYHGAKIEDIPDDYLQDLLPSVKRIVGGMKLEQYNILINNGRDAGQVVMHVHLHIIPKVKAHGLAFEGTKVTLTNEELAEKAEQIRKNLL